MNSTWQAHKKIHQTPVENLEVCFYCKIAAKNEGVDFTQQNLLVDEKKKAQKERQQKAREERKNNKSKVLKEITQDYMEVIEKTQEIISKYEQELKK